MSPEINVPKCMALLHEIIEHKKRNLRGPWELSLYPISAGSSFLATGPRLNSPEVQVLIKAGLVSYHPTCGSVNDVLRLLDAEEKEAEKILSKYISSLNRATQPIAISHA